MSRGINKCIIVGNLGDDPQVRTMPNGKQVANLSVATSESWKDQQGNPQERTEWHRITMYAGLAGVAGQYLRKGSQIYIEGKLQTRKWQDQQGSDRYTTEIIADKLEMLGGGQRNNNGGGYQGQNNQPNQPPQQQAPQQGNQPQNQPPAQGNQAPPAEPSGDNWDDDIPFDF